MKRSSGKAQSIASVGIVLALGRLAMAALQRRRAVKLHGKTAVVCGASRGLGRAIALELARRGVAKIGICARTKRDLDQVAAELAHRGVHVVAETCDLSVQAEVDRFISNACARLGQIDVLVTNAATITVGPVASLTRDDFDEALRSTFHSALNPILAVLPEMRQRRRGTIAVVTSVGARIGVPHLAPYCAAKFATLGMAESLRAEVAVDGVNVLAAVPGLMRTGSHLHAAFTGEHEREYAWFGASATAPILSIDADRAARRIVSAIARGDVEVAFTPEARLAPVLRALMPRVWAEMMAISARLLPQAPAAAARMSERREGIEIEQSSRSRAVRALSRRGRKLAERHGQIT